MTPFEERNLNSVEIFGSIREILSIQRVYALIRVGRKTVGRTTNNRRPDDASANLPAHDFPCEKAAGKSSAGNFTDGQHAGKLQNNRIGRRSADSQPFSKSADLAVGKSFL